ncbi:hypothetical protein SAMN05216331_109110 [Porphyromonadaceae bacterium KH3R12]|uniref:hypothetical protein n=1 Tax=Proteiniphilum sp. TaxID=1926877 RepID=UPI0008951D57|nr:hypothetical protein [Proteiniphilum sp.]MDY9918549.1 hypothetical protein [Proteiniphilum sp.]OJV86283.1 MAG: hypothetical protein BGO34_04610 [Bacteroidia bacterium 44-10]SDZ90476.1 hypothetical protein SAMN05216331_109110 [Porphyromonadaceae bacterium KH3R12]
MKKILVVMMAAMVILIIGGCESNRVKENRKTYMDFLKSMSDAPEFLKIISEKVNDDTPSNMYFVVEFETKYCGRELRDKVKIEFLGDLMHRFDGVWPDKYKAAFLIDIIK